MYVFWIYFHLNYRLPASYLDDVLTIFWNEHAVTLNKTLWDSILFNMSDNFG